MNNNKKLGIYGLIALFLIIVLGVCLAFAGFRLMKMNTDLHSAGKTVVYQTAFYEVQVPGGWEIEHREADDAFLEGEKQVCTIEASSGNDFESASQIIDARCLGMHGTVKGDWKEEEIGGWKKIEVTVTYEQSAAESAGGISAGPDKQYCIYTDGKGNIVEICMEDGMDLDEDMNAFLNSVQMKEI